MVVGNFHYHESRKLLRVLLDSGGTCTMINRKGLLKGANSMTLAKRMKIYTLAWVYESRGEIYMKTLCLCEFDKSRNVNKQQVLAFDAG